MAKGFSHTLVTLLFAAIASCADDSNANATSSAASATGSSPSSSTPSATSAAASASPTVPFASNDPNAALWGPDSDITPEPMRGAVGASILGPHNIPIELQNPDLLAPPSTDSGDVGSIKWPMALSPQRLTAGGWVREQTTEHLPIAQSMSGANIRLEVGAIRELHWHNVAEWAYMISGYVQISAVDEEGRNFVDNVGPGDLWYFPPGIPHSLQATDDSADGAEFMLVFDDGNFPSSDTFLLSDWLAHVPKEVIAKNFQTPQSAWKELPSRDLYIFPAVPPTTSEAPEDPQGQIPNPFTFAFSKVPKMSFSGGSVKIADSTTFTVAKTLAVAEVVVEPGAIRELHWHPTQDEWDFWLEGTGRMTLYNGGGNAKTFNFEAGDVGYIVKSAGHYVENIGNTTLKYLEVFKTDKYSDVSLAQWLALTPEAVVTANTGLSTDTVRSIRKTKQIVVGPASS